MLRRRRRRIMPGLLAVALGVYGGAARPQADDTAPVAPLPADLPISFGGPFSLVDHNGQPRTDDDFAGQFMLIYFGYTYCPDICPTNLATMAGALKRLGARAERIQPLLITVDPRRDTLALLKRYVDYFHPRLIGLSGTREQLNAALRAYRIHVSKVNRRSGATDDNYLVNHSSITYLMGPDGAFLTLFPHDTAAHTMARALANYLDRIPSPASG